MQNLFFHVSFSQSWILTKRGSDILPVDWLVKELKNGYKLSHIKTKLTECEGIVVLQDETDLFEVIKTLIIEKYDICDNSNIFNIEVHECDNCVDDCENSDEKNINNDDNNSHHEKQTEIKESSLNKIHKLIGAAEFKELGEEIALMAEILKQNKMIDSFTSRSYLMSINSGFGVTTYLELFAGLVKELGLFEFTSKTEVTEVKLSSPDIKQSSESAFSSALSYFQGRNTGRIVCIDISEWMSKLTDKEFREFLLKIDEHIGENIVFFRIPFVESGIVKQIASDINDILFVKSISIPPFNNEELIRSADKMIAQKGFTIEQEAWDVFRERIASEKSDGRFYGVNTVEKVVREMFYNKLLSNVRSGINDKIIKRNEIICIADGSVGSARSGFEQLTDLIGVEKITERIKEIIAQIEASLNNASIDAPCIHMRFVGNPGTGKTTVARILGTILKERGILRNGCFFEHSGRDLCGRFVGETAPKTAAICRDAYGSVLFIDEAYSLYRDDGFSNADYGREAIDTLVAEMENHRTDLMVIMAGYPDDMEKMMNGNIGLKSRMPYIIEFPNYTRQQLSEIFMSMVDKGFSYDEAFSDAVNEYFTSLSDEIIEAKDFSNARFVRNLFERTWGKAALRCQLDQMICDTLTVEDFALAASDKEFHNILEHKKRTIGFN